MVEISLKSIKKLWLLLIDVDPNLTLRVDKNRPINTKNANSPSSNLDPLMDKIFLELLLGLSGAPTG